MRHGRPTHASRNGTKPFQKQAIRRCRMTRRYTKDCATKGLLEFDFHSLHRLLILLYGKPAWAARQVCRHQSTQWQLYATLKMHAVPQKIRSSGNTKYRLQGDSFFRVFRRPINLLKRIKLNQSVKREPPLAVKLYQPWNEDIRNGLSLYNSTELTIKQHKINIHSTSARAAPSTAAPRGTRGTPPARRSASGSKKALVG